MDGQATVPWWKLFLDPLIPWGRSTYHRTHSSLPSCTIPFFLFVGVVCLCSYMLMTNDYFVEQILLKALGRAGTSEELEAAVRAREATQLAMRNPVMMATIALEGGLVSARSLLMVFILDHALISAVSSRWSLLPESWKLFSLSTGVLMLGVLVNTLLKVILLDENFVVGPSVFLSSFDNANIVHSALKTSDCFSIWFLTVFSRKASGITGEKTWIIGMVSACSWLIVHLVCILLGIRFAVMF